MSCPNSCQPGSYYLPSSPPTWAVGTDKNSYCAAALMGALPNEPCYSDCASFPVPCYGYAMNVVTPKPWVYPGMRQSATIQDVNNCDDLILQTTKDGSIFAGKALPPSLQQGTHVMAGYAAGGEYHYARFDADTRQWSSKNGIDYPSQYDSKNQLITDASNAAFVLSNQNLDFCGYFVTGPSLVCPSPGTPQGCVDGEPQYRPGSSWPGCGQ